MVRTPSAQCTHCILRSRDPIGDLKIRIEEARSAGRTIKKDRPPKLRAPSNVPRIRVAYHRRV